MYIQQANEENEGSSPADPVLVVQAMGRKIGFIAAATRLADPNREIPLQIYLAESKLGLRELADNVNDHLKQFGRCIVVVNEGVDVGDIGEMKDSFGHAEFGSSQSTVAQMVVNYLNKTGLAARGAARGQVPGTDQRNSMVFASTVDIDEAYKVGRKAAHIAALDGNGFMATMIRQPGSIYNVIYDKVPLELVANSERTFPESWLEPSKIDVTDDFVNYARPLIGEDWVSVPLVNGLMRFARLKPIFADKKLSTYLPMGHRPIA